jgi:hypothetical protein
MKNIYKVTILSLHLLHNISYADVAHGVLERYKKGNTFICVGLGPCINLARAYNAKFVHMHGLDEDEVFVEHAKTIFPGSFGIPASRNYHIHRGGTDELRAIMKDINEPVTILLGNYHPDIDYIKPNAVLDELEAIRQHPINTHTILIEYIQYADTELFGNISLDEVKDKLLEINRRYSFAFADGGHLEKDKNAILVAYVG